MNNPLLLIFISKRIGPKYIKWIKSTLDKYNDLYGNLVGRGIGFLRLNGSIGMGFKIILEGFEGIKEKFRAKGWACPRLSTSDVIATWLAGSGYPLQVLARIGLIFMYYLWGSLWAFRYYPSRNSEYVLSERY
jgi:hypothetical protein